MDYRVFTLQPLQFDTTGFDEFHKLLRYLVCGNRELKCWVDRNRNSIGDKFASFSYGDRLRLLNILRHHTKFEELGCEPLLDFIISKLYRFLWWWRQRPDEVFVHLFEWADLRDEIIIRLLTSAEENTGLFNRWLLFQDKHIIDLIDGIITPNVSPMSMSLPHTSVGGDITFTCNMSNTHLDSISSPQFQSLGSIHLTHDNRRRIYSGRRFDMTNNISQYNRGLRPDVVHLVLNSDGTLSQSHVSIPEFMPNSLPNNAATASLQSHSSAEEHTGLFNRWLPFQDQHIIDPIDGIITPNVSPMSMSLHHTSVGGDITFTCNMSNIHVDSISSPQFQSLGSIHLTHDNGRRLYSGRRFDMTNNISQYNRGLRPDVAHFVLNNDGTLSHSHVSIPELMPNSPPNNAASTSESRSLRPVESYDNPPGHDGEFSSGHTEEARVTTDDETARYSKLFRTVFSSLLSTIFPVFNILKPDSSRSKPLSIKFSAYLTLTFTAAAVLSSLVGVALTSLKPYIIPSYRNPQPQLGRNIQKVAVHSTAYAFIGTMCHLFLQDDPLIMWIVACISYAAFTAIMYFLGRGR